MRGRHWIIIAIVVIIILATVFFVNQNHSKKGLVLTVSHPTPTTAMAPSYAGQSATITPQTLLPTSTPTIHHIIITATPGESTTPTHELTPTP